MPRHILTEDRIHPAVRDVIAQNHRDLVDEIQKAVAENDVVVVGMAMNPVPKKARSALDEAGIPYKYLEYGSYMSLWRRRNAIKMWTGWPTFPQIFVKGTFIGGHADLARLIASGELKTLLGR